MADGLSDTPSILRRLVVPSELHFPDKPDAVVTVVREVGRDESSLSLQVRVRETAGGADRRIVERDVYLKLAPSSDGVLAETISALASPSPDKARVLDLELRDPPETVSFEVAELDSEPHSDPSTVDAAHRPAGAARPAAGGGALEEQVVLPTKILFTCVEGVASVLSLPRSEPSLPFTPSRLLSLSSLPDPLLHSLAGHTNGVVSILVHPHLPLLVSASLDSTVRVWDLDARTLLCTLVGHAGHIYGLALDPAGRRLASGSDDNIVRLWDLDSGACLRTLAGHWSHVYAVAWEAAGSLVASGSGDNTVRLWHADSGALRHTLEGHSHYVYALAAHPADDLLASGSVDATVCVWRWSSGAHVRTLAGHKRAVCSLAASAAWLVSGSADQSVRVWSWASGACARVLDGFAGELFENSLAWRDSALVTLENDYTVRVWDASSADASAWSCVGSLASKASYPHGVAVVGGRRVSCAAPGDSSAIAVWGV